MAIIDVNDFELASEVYQSSLPDSHDRLGAHESAQVGHYGDVNFTACDPDLAAAVADGGEGSAFVQTRTNLSAIRQALMESCTDVPALVEQCVDFVRAYAPGFRPGHAPRDGRCRTCGRTISEVLRLRERSVHGRLTLAEPEVVDELPLPPHRLRHIKGHTVRCAERAAVREQAPEILRRLEKTVPAKALSPKGTELEVERFAEALRRLFGEDYQGDSYRQVTCRLCGEEQPVLKSRMLALSHLVLKHNILVPYTLPPASVPNFTAESLGLEAVWDADTGMYAVDPVEQHSLALKILRNLLAPQDDEAEMGSHPDIIVPNSMKQEGAYDRRFDSDSGQCLLCATNPLLPPVEQARYYKDLRSHLATCLKDHLRLLIDLTIDRCAHKERFLTTHLWQNVEPTCPHPNCPPLENSSPLALVWHLAAFHGIYFGGTNGNTAKTWRPTFRNPIRVEDLTFPTEAALVSWATEATIRNTVVAPDLSGLTEIVMPSIRKPLEIECPLDVQAGPPQPLTVFKKLELWRQANPVRINHPVDSSSGS